MADTVKRAGWVLSVLLRTSSGPSAMSFESEKPRISSACIIIFLAEHLLGHAVAVPVEDAVVVALPHEHVRHDFGEAVIQSLQDFVTLGQIEFSLLQVDEAVHDLVLHAG